MASTNKTTHYELSQYVGSDKPTYLGDYNSDMLKIDSGINSAKTTADTANTAATNAASAASNAQTTADTAVTNASNAQTTANGAVASIGDLLSLNTINKTNLVAAINEIIEQTGVIKAFAGSTAPTGYLICDGAAVSRSTYSRLFNVIGTTFGTGDGSTTFNLPNLDGKVITGYDPLQTEFDTIGKTGGEKTHQLTVNEMPTHAHVETIWTGGSGVSAEKIQAAPVDAGPTGGETSATAGGDQAHNNLQPYMVLNYIIKY